MTKLKLGPLPDQKSVKIMPSRLPAAVYRDLVTYAEALGSAAGQTAPDPTKLVVPMIERFMATDRGFSKIRRQKPSM